MGLIEKIKNSLPFGGKPESNITVSDFESQDNSENSNENEPEESSNENSENENSENESEQSEGNGDEKQDNENSDEKDGGNGNNEDSEKQDGEDSEEENNGNSNSEDSEKQDDEKSNEGSGNNENEYSEENELDNIKSEMDNSSAERDMNDWENSDGEISSDFIEQQFKNLQEKRTEPSSEIGIRQKERDERIENVNTIVSAEQVLEKYEERFADEIKEAFRKIKTKEAPKPAEYGQRINMRGVIRRRSGDQSEERLYLEMDQSEVGDRCITVVVDSSGSMDELEIKLALMALADACEQIGDRFIATHYCTTTTRFSNPGVETNLITAPTERFKKEHLNSFNAYGYTPTPDGIKDGRSLSELSPNNEDVIIVITDGVANIGHDGKKYSNEPSNKPMKESKEQVNAALNEGKRVIGIGVGPNLKNESMEKIFGSSYIRTDMDGIADTLVNIYKKQMKTIKH